MVNYTKPRTLTPYELVASEDDNEYVAEGETAIKSYEQFNNWSNWGNGSTDPARKPARSYEQFNNWSNWSNGPGSPQRSSEKDLETALK